VLEAKAMMYEVSPLLDPSRGGRWGCVQLWRDLGSVQVAQLAEVKWRIVTPEGGDVAGELAEMAHRAVRFFTEEDVTTVATINSVVM
jgi:hypothetical protein